MAGFTVAADFMVVGALVAAAFTAEVAAPCTAVADATTTGSVFGWPDKYRHSH